MSKELRGIIAVDDVKRSSSRGPAIGRACFFHLLLLVVAMVAHFSTATATGDADVIQDLTKLIANPPASWVSGSSSVCSFIGITCSDSGRITKVNLTNMGLSGTLTPLISSLDFLESLELEGNTFSGTLPSLSGMRYLTRLTLNGNLFTSVPYNFFRGLNSLTVLEMHGLPLEPWSIPDSISDCTALQKLSVSNASVTGSLPLSLANLTSLAILKLSDNYLTGDLPAWLAGFSGLEVLTLSNQKSDVKLSGPIDILASFKNLKLLWIQSNAFTGQIPDFNNSQLESFDVRDNRLTGLVPSSLMEMENLLFVGLSNNLFQGPRPEFQDGVTVDIFSGNSFCLHESGPCDLQVTNLLEVSAGFQYPIEIAKSWSGNNPCNGWIGIACRDIMVVEVILSNRNLSGTISQAFAKLTLLEKIDLSNNQLTGVIPDALITLTRLNFFSVSNNNLTGLVPIFKPSVEVITTGGNGLDPPGSQNSKSRVRNIALIIGIVIAAAVISVICVWVSLYLLRRKNESRSTLPTHIPTVSKNSFHCAKSSVEEVQIAVLLDATNNFSQDNIIGTGGSAVVYKGNLNGMHVAVKRHDSANINTESLQDFVAEIEVLGKLKHWNLVQLLGYCINAAERILIYEYMSAGSLRDHLKQRGHTPLTWTQRVTIALDVARGIQYIHSLAHESFVHRDLKPSNILLDVNLRAKLSDFGLIRPAADKDRVKPAGTYGYLAPEYANGGCLTTMVDVYAYGIIVMEIITGREVLDYTLAKDDIYFLPIFRRNAMDKDGLRKIVDPTLEDLSPKDWNTLLVLADLARHCTAQQPSQRPDIDHCVNTISTVVDQWRPVLTDDEDEITTMNLNEYVKKWREEDLKMSEGSVEASRS